MNEQIEEAKGWVKRNWKPFVAGAAVAGVTILVFRGSRYPFSTLPPSVVFSKEMVAFLEKNGSAAIQMGPDKVVDIIDWSHPMTATHPPLKAMFE